MGNVAPLVCLFVLLAAAPASAYELQHSPEGGAVVRWNREVVTYRISPGLSAELGAAEVQQAVRDAAAAWDVGGMVPVIEISPWPASPYVEREPGVNGIYLVDPDDYVWEDSAVAATLNVYWGDGEMESADIVLNGDKRLCFGCKNGFDLQGVLTHEFGHALGLDHSGESGATMGKRARLGDTSQRDLTTDDIEGALAAYAHPFESDSWAQMGCQATPHRHDRHPAWFLLVVALLAVAWWRSRRV